MPKNRPKLYAIWLNSPGPCRLTRVHDHPALAIDRLRGCSSTPAGTLRESARRSSRPIGAPFPRRWRAHPSTLSSAATTCRASGVSVSILRPTCIQARPRTTSRSRSTADPPLARRGSTPPGAPLPVRAPPARDQHIRPRIGGPERRRGVEDVARAPVPEIPQIEDRVDYGRRVARRHLPDLQSTE